MIKEFLFYGWTWNLCLVCIYIHFIELCIFYVITITQYVKERKSLLLSMGPLIQREHHLQKHKVLIKIFYLNTSNI